MALLQSTDEQGNTCLHLAALHNHHEILSFLLEHSRISPDAQNRDGLTALHLACENGIQCVRALLDHPGADRVINMGRGNQNKNLFFRPKNVVLLRLS